MYQLTNDPDVIRCVETGALIPRDHRDWPAEWLQENAALPQEPPYALHSPQHYQAIRAAAWDWMTAWVKERRYDTIETCCSYFNSSVPRYRDEARAMVAWRDAVNQELESLVLAAPAGIETWEQVRALLPQPEAFNWPGEVSLPLGTGESAVLE